MNNPFKRPDFDSVIAKGVTVLGSVELVKDHVLVIDGNLAGDSIRMSSAVGDGVTKTAVFIGGDVALKSSCQVHNVTVTGSMKIGIDLIVEGVLSVKAGAHVIARVIQYRHLHMEKGAVVMGTMKHLDHTPKDELIVPRPPLGVTKTVT